VQNNGAEEYITRGNDYEFNGWISLYFMAFVEAIFLLTGSMDNPLGEGSSPRQKNFGSLIVVSIFGPVGCVYVAHIIAIIVLETNLSNYLKIKHEENYALIHRALENLNAPHGLRRRVFSLYRFQQMGHDQEALTSLLDKKNTSSALDSALRLVLYKDSVLHSRYFYAKDPNYILEVLRVLEDHMFLPGDFIIRYGEVGTQMYFVNRGEMKVISSKSVVFHEISHKGDFFGEIALVRDCRRTASVRAESYVICCTLSRQCIRDVNKINIGFPNRPAFPSAFAVRGRCEAGSW
jgi:voltage-gated potassium channel